MKVADLLQVARKKLTRIAKDAEVIQEFIGSGESFLSKSRTNCAGQIRDVEDMGEFIAQAEAILRDAREQLGERLDEARRLDDFIRCGETLQLEVNIEADRAPPQQPTRRPLRMAEGPSQVARMAHNPAADWVSLFAWVTLLGIALYDWTSN